MNGSPQESVPVAEGLRLFFDGRRLLLHNTVILIVRPSCWK